MTWAVLFGADPDCFDAIRCGCCCCWTSGPERDDDAVAASGSASMMPIRIDGVGGTATSEPLRRRNLDGQRPSCSAAGQGRDVCDGCLECWPRTEAANWE